MTDQQEPSSSSPLKKKLGHGFGTAPVFLASASTILGAIMFLRFGYAVGHVGLIRVILLILLGHLVTIPTAMAISEIATNRRVLGGGEYYIISRSFGAAIGGAIGLSLYLSQAISVGFYMLAFAEAFRPLLALAQEAGFVSDARLVSVPATMVLLLVILKKGAGLGVKALWGVCSVLAVSLILFFLGSGGADIRPEELRLAASVADPDPFILVFAICFPAFTGMTAGVGLSGDLKNPGRSIPLGTITGTLFGMVVYVLIVIKLASNATPEALAADPLIMARIALWGPIVPIGLAAATLSSAVGSILIAPRTLQALGRDKILPFEGANTVVATGRGSENEPVNATFISSAIAMTVVAMGDVDFVAQIISMFFMVTYGALCSVSFLEHFAGNPSYRPTFRSRWYLSLLGAVMSVFIMFQMQPLYAALALALMYGIYRVLKYAHAGERDLAVIFQGVMFQLTRRLHISLQRARATADPRDWRPTFLALSQRATKQPALFDLMRWICHRQGFGEIIHVQESPLDAEALELAAETRETLIRRTEISHASVFVDEVVAPSYRAALSQLIQLPGISGLDRNSLLFEFDSEHPAEITEIEESAQLVCRLEKNVCVLRSSNARFGYRRSIHVWLTEDDYQNAPLMILLAYILVGHPDWTEAEIHLFACYPVAEMDRELRRLTEMIEQGRLPISSQNVTTVFYDDESSFERSAGIHSAEADLVILGITRQTILSGLRTVLEGHPDLADVLFVYASDRIEIS
jgi:amino acid transporter